MQTRRGVGDRGRVRVKAAFGRVESGPFAARSSYKQLSSRQETVWAGRQDMHTCTHPTGGHTDRVKERGREPTKGHTSTYRVHVNGRIPLNFCELKFLKFPVSLLAARHVGMPLIVVAGNRRHMGQTTDQTLPDQKVLHVRLGLGPSGCSTSS